MFAMASRVMRTKSSPRKSSPRRPASIARLAHIQGATAHITSLVEDVLDIAKIKAGALTVHLTQVDLASVLPDIVELLRPLAAERGITLRLRQATGTVRADERRLRQVVINLITNAIRYNKPEGQVEVGVAAAAHGCAIRVTDTGPGIDPGMSERLFIPFDRLGAESSPEQGTRLGLPLARGLTEAMGGHLAIDSQPGIGTTSTVILPPGQAHARHPVAV
jgi:signal transduction histidine kinase